MPKESYSKLADMLTSYLEAFDATPSGISMSTIFNPGARFLRMNPIRLEVTRHATVAGRQLQQLDSPLPLITQRGHDPRQFLRRTLAVLEVVIDVAIERLPQ